MPRIIKSIVVPVLLCFSLLGADFAAAETTSFSDPMYGRYRLDFCRFDRDDCGIGAARAWCIREGYDEALSYRGARGVGSTMRVGNRTTCRGGSCDGFAEITCERADPVDDAPGAEDTLATEE